MADQLKDFQDAKAVFLRKARNASATAGVINNLESLEADLVCLVFILTRSI